MIPRRPAQVFRSRWSALFWAAGVIFTAVTFIGFAPDKQDGPANSPASNGEAPVLTDDSGAPVSNQDLTVLKDFLNAQ